MDGEECTEEVATGRIADMAESLYEKAEYTRANSLISQAAMRADADASIFHNLGLVRAALGDFKGAIEAYSRSVDEIPDGLVNRGFCYEELDQPLEARLDYERALDIDPRDTEALVNLGLLDLDEGDLPSARERLSLAAEIDPTANWQLSDVFLAEGDIDGAIAALKVAVSHGEDRAREPLDKLMEEDSKAELDQE